MHRVYAAIHRASGLDPRFNSRLTEDEHDQIATLRTQGLSTGEIARKLGRSERTVYRAVARLEGLNMFDKDKNGT